MRIITEIVPNRHPLWALRALAYLPYDRDIDYPEERLQEMRSVLYNYLRDFEYTERNTKRILQNTHFITEQEHVITVHSKQGDEPILYIVLSNGESDICAECGCTEDNACYDPYLGACWWIGKKKILCSHCAILDYLQYNPVTL